MIEKHEQCWEVVTINRENLIKMLNEYRFEGGFIGERRFNTQSMGQANANLTDLTSKLDKLKEEFTNKYEILDHDTMQTEQKLDKLSKLVKQLNEERLDNVGFADRKIQGHIKKGLE